MPRLCPHRPPSQNNGGWTATGDYTIDYNYEAGEQTPRRPFCTRGLEVPGVEYPLPRVRRRSPCSPSVPTASVPGLSIHCRVCGGGAVFYGVMASNHPELLRSYPNPILDFVPSAKQYAIS